MAGPHIATVRQFNAATGTATVVVPALYGDTPVEARAFMSSPRLAAYLPLLLPGDTVLVFYDGGNPTTILRWYPTGANAGGSGGGGDEIWIGPTDPGVASGYEFWYNSAVAGGLLSVKVAGQWVPYSPSGNVVPPAYAGPGGTTAAKFGNTNLSAMGLWLYNNGYVYLTHGQGAQIEYYAQQGAGTTQIGSHNQSLFQVSSAKSQVSGMGIGPSPPYGGAYVSLWRAGVEGGNDYILLANAGGTFLNTPPGGGMYFRRGNADIMSIGTDNYVTFPGIVKGGGNTEIGNHSVYFASYGGGWYMADGTWVRSINNKNVWLGSGWYGGDGGITIGRGGEVDGNYKLDINGSGHIWGSFWVSGNHDVNGIVRVYNTLIGGQADLGGNVAWNNAHILAYGQGDPGQQTRIAWHSPGSAPQIRNIGGFGDILQCVNQLASGHCPIQSSNFQTISTTKVKKDVKSLRPERDTITVERDPFEDTIVAPPDIMALNVVTYRPKIGQLQIVATDPSGDYATVDIEKPETFESVARTDFMGDQSRREQLGLIAEEVQHVIPSAVFHDPDKQAQAILYDQITVALLDHVQQLTALVQTLQYRIAELERQAEENQ